MRKDLIITGILIFLTGYINGILVDTSHLASIVTFVVSGLELVAQIVGIIIIIVGFIKKK